MEALTRIPEEPPRGLLVFLHGYASDPGYLEAAVPVFLRSGFVVVLPAAPDHGPRARPEGFPTDDWEALAAHAAQVVADWIPELAEAVPRWQTEHGLPLYAAGFSMGAYVWHELISRRLARPVAAALFGMGAIPNVPLPEGAESPLARANAYPPTALLQIHGEDDEIVALELVEHTLESLRPAYARHPGRLGLLKVAGAGHELTPGMAEAAAGWLSAWRPNDEGTPRG